MTDWRPLLQDFVAGGLSPGDFHDRFFLLWRRQFQGDDPPPAPVEALFFIVEAFCPDPALRDPAAPWEADEAELRAGAAAALAALGPPGA